MAVFSIILYAADSNYSFFLLSDDCALILCPCMDGARVGGAHDYAELVNLAIIPPTTKDGLSSFSFGCSHLAGLLLSPGWTSCTVYA